MWRMSRNMKQFKPKVSMLLISDGTLDFVALLVMNVVTLLLDIYAKQIQDESTAFNFVNDVIGPTLIARFILDLRSVYFPENAPEQTTTTVLFASKSSMENMAAPLGSDSTWASGAADDVRHGHGELYQESKEPFYFVDSDSFDAELQVNNLGGFEMVDVESISSPSTPFQGRSSSDVALPVSQV